MNQQLSHKKKVMTIQMTILMRMTSKSQLEISKPLQLQGTLLHCFSIHNNMWTGHKNSTCPTVTSGLWSRTSGHFDNFNDFFFFHIIQWAVLLEIFLECSCPCELHAITTVLNILLFTVCKFWFSIQNNINFVGKNNVN